MSDGLEPGDLICIYEVWADPDSGDTGGAKAIVALAEIQSTLYNKERK